ncbi:MAG TPA: putative glycoside hydrolase [Solirubrobacteraceae bacterium]|nr:putative glycoside hydrolase [Solirubrobacteraceae bacterium]
MNAGQQQELSRWAATLEESGSDERRAAGRAIRLLTEANLALEHARGNGGGPVEPVDRRELERLAGRLADAEAAELRAAARAIRTLCAEHERLEHDDRPAGSAPKSEARVRRPSRRALIVLGVLVLIAGGVAFAARAAAPDLHANGPENGAVLDAQALASLSISSRNVDADWSLDGQPVQPQRTGDEVVFTPRRLPDGPHEVVLRTHRRMLGSSEKRFRFVVDTTAPTLTLDGPAVVARGAPLRLAGRLERGSTLLAGTRPVPVARNGRFELRVAAPPRSLILAAADAAGNRSRWRVPVTAVPRRPEAPIRAVHVTAYAWANDALRRGILDLVRAKKINAVELDLKDEAGEVGWASGVPLAKQIGSQLRIYDLKSALDRLHGLGVRVIGRIVCFRDPIHANAAWKAGRREEVVQKADGGPYSGYGGFTNFASPAVQRYNIALARAAAKLGVDEILYDYVRRPDGPLSSMRFPGLQGTPEAAIVGFLRESRKALAGTNALLGASVFGVAATRPREVAQDIPAMAREVDYIAPMLYPSHWGPGEYGVADPNAQPYAIVRASTKDFVRQVRGSGARIVNWLQDFSYGREYSAKEVRAQINASRDVGVDDFILWDAAVDYTPDALDASAEVPTLALSTSAPKDAPRPVRLADRKPPAARAAAPASEAKPVRRPLPGLPPNELGRIPVVMHHMVRSDRVGDYDQTPGEFRAELDYLWRHGYTPVNVGDLLSARLNVPAGTTPVAFTFDDATTYQIDFAADGSVKPKTAVGIMLEFARSHPGFSPAGTFYVNRTPFGSDAAAKRALPWLIAHGFELGNHTHGHVPLRTLSDDEVRKQVATGAAVIEDVLPGYAIRSLALPLGSMPHDSTLAVRGSWQGRAYGPYAVLLVGANPAPSPFAKEFDPRAIPRIRTSHAGWDGTEDFAFSDWMRRLAQNPGTRYISDGDASTVAVPEGAQANVRPRFATRVRTSD